MTFLQPTACEGAHYHGLFNESPPPALLLADKTLIPFVFFSPSTPQHIISTHVQADCILLHDMI